MKVSATKIENKSLSSGKNTLQPSFKGGYTMSREIAKKVIVESNPNVRFLMNLGKNNGEILNSIVTALGTAFVAPLFIAFNPFSKEDSETKIYSAFRQPISAVIALAAQVGINVKFNQWLDTLASTGQLDRADLTAKPQASHLKKILKLQKPELTPKDIAAEIQFRQDEAFWQKVNSNRHKMKNVPIPTEKLIDTNAMNDAKKIIKGQFAEQISKMNKKDSTKFINAKAREIVADLVDKTLKEEAVYKYQIISFAESGKSTATVIKELEANLKKKIASNASKDQIEKLQHIIEKVKGTRDFKYVKKLGNNLEEVLQSVRIKKLVKAGINNAEAVLSSYKKWGGIFISLLTLPVSCGLLNWSYPRIMEVVMPHISKDNNDAGGDD